jgi:hypothetical protein
MARTTNLRSTGTGDTWSSGREHAHGDPPVAPPPTAGGIEALIEDAVFSAVARLLEPHLARLVEPEPLVYTVTQAATALQVSPDTVTRLVRRGVLDRVPHIDGKQLIPRASLDRLVDGDAATEG